MSDQFKMRVAGSSNVGLKREINEDAFYLDPENYCFSVADGVGGSNAGEVASKLFVSTIARLFSNKVNSEEEAASAIKRIFTTANSEILQSSRQNKDQQGMACTAELLVFHDHRFTIGHVGDSRTYRFRNGCLVQISKDHSLVQEQLDRGKISEDEVVSHRYRNVILRAVGSEETLDVDLISGEVNPGDSFLLCSDGLTDMVDDKDIKECLRTSSGVENKVNLLVDLANRAGGKDNITVILIETGE